MCGIAGKIDTKGSSISDSDLKSMLSMINHRGPDDEGIFIEKNIALGHKRLSIIDLSPKGHQPMVSVEGNLVITFNGEIYNYQSLRKELKDSGIKFKSQTDTEVLLYLYQKHGTGCLKKLRGMFAFVIFDKSKNIIFGARDRLGIKPLKYFWDGRYFIFSSEAKALLTDPNVKKEVDYQAIYDYLSFSYVPHPRTGFKNIYKLPQAHYFTLNLSNKKFEIYKYWDLDYNNKLKIPDHELKKLLLSKIEESIKLRMISDVPLGVFLSGGLDSSLVAHYMAHNSKQPIKTFSIRSDVPKYDEGKYINIIVDRYKTDHHELYIKPSSFDDLNKMVLGYEEPFGDPSMLPLYNLSSYASKHITVSLCGEGGDEDFGGYSYYLKMNYLNKLNKYPKFIRRLRAEITNYYWHNVKRNKFIELDDDFLKKALKSDNNIYSEIRSHLSDCQKNKMIKADWIKENDLAFSSNFFTKILRNKYFSHPLDKIFYTDYFSYIPDDLMTKLDIASMAHGIEGRVPLLDHELVELCAKFTPKQKIKGFETKYFLKKSLEGILPNRIIHRRKLGFGMPVNEWFRNELKLYIKDSLFDKNSFILEIFNKDELQKYFQKHLDRKSNLGNNFWNLLTLELWHRNYFK